MWIKLHFYQGGDVVAVQTQNVCAVYSDQRKQYKGATCVQFIGEEESYIQVKETVDEIEAMITE